MINLTGTVTRVTFHSPDTGYTVMKLDTGTPMFKDETTVVGNFAPAPQEHEQLTLSGSWTKHPKYGDQFKVERVGQRQIGQTVEALVAYLSSGLFSGIGPAKADAIVKKFRMQTSDVITNTPARLAEVKGVTADMAVAIGTAWKEHEAARQVMTWLCSYGLTPVMATKIYHAYGDETIQKLTENPYQMAADIDGIGFIKADDIARLILKDYRPDVPYRVRAGIVHVLRESRNDGHVYLPYDLLVEKAEALLGVLKAPIQSLLDAMPLLPNAEVVIETDTPGKPVYYWRLHQAECGVSSQLKHITALFGALDSLKEKLAETVSEAESKLTFKLTDQQRAAVVMALSSKVSIITGGPGVGKSTILRLVVDVLKATDHSFVLASPTGRAAKRLGEATGCNAQTIHRLLKFNPAGYFEKNEDDPIYAEMIIVDEASMLDLSLFHSLLKATRQITHLLIVGDPDQLPSVGAGDVLHELIRSNKFPVAKLDTIFRQAEGSTIITAAHQINAGRMPDLTPHPDWLFIEAREQIIMAQVIVDLVTKGLPEKGYDPTRDIQVLAPMYKGEAGVNQLNTMLRERLNPGPADPRHKFRVGDKVMQLKNNYEKDVFNGDTGYVVEVDPDDHITYVMVDNHRVSYESRDLDQLTLAYACTVHKSQGSEYPVVIVGLHSSHYIMLKRNLLYTGITRGKGLVILVGDKRGIGMAVAKADTAVRYTRLAVRLNG